MRVIGGIYRSRRLRAVEGLGVRPTSDRLRETLFNVLGAGVRGGHFLDLCAGSGAVGIEALSRGARRAVFVEQSRRACAVIEANLRALDIADQAGLVCREARAALKQLAADNDAFDFIFFDPPYASGLYAAVLSDLGGGAVLGDAAVVVVEHRAKLPLADGYGRLSRFRELKQGESALAFYRAE
ncbi:MAG TPA: 16S rRNA (guanine(966)-N(2))-methyltransferase RsmD [Blastocatellia bacterium]|nr:16S rRNA (guanine(966)-N(2))-methyltransferase RsmD [Blastocatellia bacterium]